MSLFELEFCLHICPGVGLLDRMVTPVLVFSGSSIRFSTVTTQTCIPTNSVGGFPFLHTLPSTKCRLFFFFFLVLVPDLLINIHSFIHSLIHSFNKYLWHLFYSKH